MSRSPALVLASALSLATLVAGPSRAGPVSFAGGWQEQRLQLFGSNDYTLGTDLGVASDGAVSLLWTRTAPADWSSRAASWSWRVDEGVAATDLSVRGGDDRNLSLYFVFLPEEVARTMEGAGIAALNGRAEVRILQYVWGGTAPRGTRFGSPYAPGQGVNVILRPAGTGAFSESVDLAADFRAAFGAEPSALVGLAVSADSDDTGGRIRAAVGSLVLR